MIRRCGVQLILATIAIAGCVPVFSPAADYAAPDALCEIDDARIDEASGLAAGRRYPDLYYTHNDSAGKPYVYAIDRTGRIRATIRLIGAANYDWEDIAVAPGETPGVFDVCVADVGDNKARRSRVSIYCFPEPELDLNEQHVVVDVRPKRYKCIYETGPRNAEGFVVDPLTGDAYVFDKRKAGGCGVYVLKSPWDEKDVNVLRPAGELQFPAAPPTTTMTTAADVSPDGKRLVLRSYLSAWEWTAPEATNGFAAFFELTPAPVRTAVEQQGEAICYTADGEALLTVSEGAPTTLYEMRREKNDTAPTP